MEMMQTATEQIAPLGSHRFLDQLNLAYHRGVAVRLPASPKDVLQTAYENLRRWQKVHEGTTTAQFFELDEDGIYEAAALDEDGFYHSQVVAGFRLRVDWLWQSPMPATLDVLRELKVL